MGKLRISILAATICVFGYYEELGRAAGFEVGAARNMGQWFYLELKKP